jgi:hypothetical protein
LVFFIWSHLRQINYGIFYYFLIMKIISIITLLLLLTNCAGGNVAQIKFGKRCTIADSKQLQEASYVWFISKEASKSFNKRINKSNCLNG